MNQLAYLYVTLIGARKFCSGQSCSEEFRNIYRDAFLCAIKCGCPCIEEGNLYLLSLFNDIFKIQKGLLDPVKNKKENPKPTGKPVKQSSESVTEQEAPSNPAPKGINIPDNNSDVIRSASRILHIRKEKAENQAGEENHASDKPEASDDEDPSPDNLSPAEVKDLYRHIHFITVESFDVDTNTGERTLKSTEEINITVYPMELVENSISASVMAIIDNDHTRTVFTKGIEGGKSLICDFKGYHFIVRGQFDSGSFITQVNPYNDTADESRYTVTEHNVVREVPKDRSSIGHSILSIGNYTEHLFPLDYKNNENGLCPFILVNEFEGKREPVQTADQSYVLLKLGDQSYQFFSSWTDNGTYKAEYKNITGKIKR